MCNIRPMTKPIKVIVSYDCVPISSKIKLNFELAKIRSYLKVNKFSYK